MINFNFDKYRLLNKFQTGGQVATKSKQYAEDLQEKAMVYATLGMIGYAASQLKQMDFATAVAEVMQYGQSPEGMKLLQLIAGNKELVKAGMEIMRQKEPEMLQLISQPGGFKQILAQIEQQQNQLQTVMAKQGAKLSYINSLKGICPEGYEMSYMKAGGKVCPVCKKKVKINKDCGGVKMKIHATGGISEMMNQIKTDLLACGGKMKKVKKDLDGGKAFSDKEMSDYGKLYYMAERKTNYPNASQALLEGKEPITVWRKDKNGKKFKFTGIFKNNSSNPFDLHPYTK